MKLGYSTMLEQIWNWDRNKVAVIMPTMHCNITCEHCLLACSARTRDTMTEDQINKWTREFIDLGFSPICLSGGEVFLYPDLVRIASLACKENNTPFVIQTNGFWASIPERAQRMLESIPFITQLGFSVDYAHMKFIKKSTIENGIRAAYEAGIDNINLSISYRNLSECNDIKSYFQLRFPKLVIDAWPISPVGRAKEHPELYCESEFHTWNYLPRMCEAQRAFTPIVDPLGNVHLCYHLIMCLGINDPFLIGNLSNTSLSEMLDKISDPLYSFILAYGGGSLGYLLQIVAPEMLEQEYQRVCQLCYEVFSRKDVVSRLRQLLSTPDFADKIEEMIESRYIRPQSVSGKKSEKIIICSGKNCFMKEKNKHLRYYLANRLVDSGNWKYADIECVNCFKKCKYGPNLKLQRSERMIHDVNAEKIDAIMNDLENSRNCS